MIDSSHKLSIVKQCELLEISRSNLYYSAKEIYVENLEIMKLMSRQYYVTPFYGYRKVTVWLENQNFLINEKRVRRLLEIINWKTIYREPRTTISNKEHKKYPYLLKGLEITHKNQVYSSFYSNFGFRDVLRSWATDITYIPMAKGFMYLCAIIDLLKFYLNLGFRDTASLNCTQDLF